MFFDVFLLPNPLHRTSTSRCWRPILISSCDKTQDVSAIGNMAQNVDGGVGPFGSQVNEKRKPSILTQKQTKLMRWSHCRSLVCFLNTNTGGLLHHELVTMWNFTFAKMDMVSTAMFHPLFSSCETTSHAYIGFVLAWMRRMATFGTPYLDSMMWISLSLSHVYLPEREVQLMHLIYLALNPIGLCLTIHLKQLQPKKLEFLIPLQLESISKSIQ